MTDSMIDSMIDKVAMALADSLDDSLSWMEYREQAVTAIEAMKPTTTRMDVAGAIYLRGHISDASGCFETMIDAALGEGKE